MQPRSNYIVSKASRDALVRKTGRAHETEQKLHSAKVSDDGREPRKSQHLAGPPRTQPWRSIRELKHRNADLEQRAATRIAAPAAVPDGPLDWEAQKRIFLAALEAEDPTHETRRQEHLTIDGTIRITDTIIQEKDREITELKQLLTEQSQSVGTMAVGAAALGGILDSDEIIRQQRERLSQLQTEWEEKMRQAEIDISMERAKLARERADLDEESSACTLEEQLQAQLPTTTSDGGARQRRRRNRTATRPMAQPSGTARERH